MSRPPSYNEKEAYVCGVFSSIVPVYDFLNAALSLGRHAAWRRSAVSLMDVGHGGLVLDVCTGTGDLAFEMAARVGESGCVAGVDFSVPMIEEARRKSRTRDRGCVELFAARADALPFADSSFDAAGVAFGLRNVPNVKAAVGEMARVVRPGGRVVSLEIVGVRRGLVGILWNLYFHMLVPRAAVLFGGSRQAYQYLSESVAGFMSADEMDNLFRECGLRDVRHFPLALGGVCVHVGLR